ncbi:MAG: cyanophycin synthetase [Candidatus Paceibacterota bacterium]
MAAAIAGAREVAPDRKLTVVFQPHTYSRTHELFGEFATALSTADKVLLLPIYAAREENTSGVTSEKLVEAINVLGQKAEALPDFTTVIEQIKGSVTEKDLVLVMGAGM